MLARMDAATILTTPVDHTFSQPYCTSLECSCHTNSVYHEEVISSHTTIEQYQQALEFFFVKLPEVEVAA